MPWELGNLPALDTLRLSGNRLEGCLRPALRRVTTNDLGELGLPYCTEDGRVPSPTGLVVSLSGGTFSISWTAVRDAARYEAQYRIAGDDDYWLWMADISQDTAVNYSPEDGTVCGSTYEFRVRAYGDGTTYAGWSAASAVQSVTTEACNP